MSTHENIKMLRERRGLSQGKLAEMTGYKDRSSIAKIEAGLVDLSQSKISAFAEALGVTPAELMGIGGEPPQISSPLELSPSESELVVAYRAADDRSRAIVDITLEPFKPRTAARAV